ncbi:MAG: hypothetical protein ACRDXX_06770 [Stackebrandtia sp.]
MTIAASSTGGSTNPPGHAADGAAVSSQSLGPLISVRTLVILLAAAIPAVSALYWQTLGVVVTTFIAAAIGLHSLTAR